MKGEKFTKIWICGLVFIAGFGGGYAIGYADAVNFCVEQAVKVLNIDTNFTGYGIQLIQKGIRMGVIN